VSRAIPASTDSPTDDGDRVEGIQTTTERLPEPAIHGAAGKFVLQDAYRPADPVVEQWAVGDGRRIPDGSLYQWARAAQYACEPVEDDTGRERYVLSREYEHPDDDEDDQYAVVLTDSRWKVGTGTGDDYRPWFKYDLTLKPLDADGTVAWDRTPARALTVKLHPQVEGLVYQDGNELRLPHGEGTLVQVQATWAETFAEFRERAAGLVAHALGYGWAASDVVPDSEGFHKLELHHRFIAEKEADVVHTLRQSADLLAQHAADVTTKGIHEDDTWLEAQLATDAWEQLGFRRFDASALLKAYYPDATDSVEYPMDQPKLEVALQGTGDGAIPAAQWDELLAALNEILLSHLKWAGVSAAGIVADDYSDGPAADPVAWAHPEGRRHWLRKHYESLVPALYREATSQHTDLVYDVLDVIRRHGTCTYQTLMNETGAAYRTVREHVRRLEELGGGDPGIVERIQDVETWVAFSSRYFEDEADEALAEIKPDDTPADREARAERRRQRRKKRRARRTDDDPEPDEDPDWSREGGAVGDGDGAASTGADGSEDGSGDGRDDRGPIWKAFDEVSLTARQLGEALEREFVPPDHVRVRVDRSPLFLDDVG
jgi:hypothetical protein